MSPSQQNITSWYRSGYVWLVLSPLIATIVAMIITMVILHRSGSVEQFDNLGQPLGKVYTGTRDHPDSTTDEQHD